MFQSIWTIFREPTLVLAKVTPFQTFTIEIQRENIFSVVVQAVCVSCAVRSTAQDTHTEMSHMFLLEYIQAMV
jgi:hypothetical protein